jgi:hypothetical protein
MHVPYATVGGARGGLYVYFALGRTGRVELDVTSYSRQTTDTGLFLAVNSQRSAAQHSTGRHRLCPINVRDPEAQETAGWRTDLRMSRESALRTA